MSSIISLIILILIQLPVDSNQYRFLSNPTTHIDWCLYFQRLQIYKPESKPISTAPIYPVIRYEMQQCSPHYMYCTANDQCGPGHLRCIDMAKFRECCAPQKRDCPHISYLNFRCLVPTPTNWCNVDSDCHTTPQKQCCPTGCNYNICI